MAKPNDPLSQLLPRNEIAKIAGEQTVGRRTLALETMQQQALVVNPNDIAAVKVIAEAALTEANAAAGAAAHALVVADTAEATAEAAQATANNKGPPIQVFDEGISLTLEAFSFDFQGTGVTATESSGSITVTIPGGTGGTVTSVDISSPGSTLAVGGGPVTTTGTLTADLTTTAVTAGSYTSADIDVDKYGRITKAANGAGGGGTVTSIATGTGLTGGPITGTGTISLANTAVTPGSYTNTNLTVDAQGRITAASNGSAGSGTVTSVSLSSPLGGGTVTTSGTLGTSSYTNHGVVIGQGASALTVTSAGTAGQVLTSGGASADPTWGPNSPLVVSTQSGTSYSLALTDAYGYIQFTSGSAVTVTVTKQATVAWAANTTIACERSGAGSVTFLADTGVTINKISSTLAIAGQYGVAQLVRTASDTWTLFGALS